MKNTGKYLLTWKRSKRIRWEVISISIKGRVAEMAGCGGIGVQDLSRNDHETSFRDELSF